MSPNDVRTRRIPVEQLKEMFTRGLGRCSMVTEVNLGTSRRSWKRAWRCRRRARILVLLTCPTHGPKRTGLCRRHSALLLSGLGTLLCSTCDQPATWKPL